LFVNSTVADGFGKLYDLLKLRFVLNKDDADSSKKDVSENNNAKEHKNDRENSAVFFDSKNKNRNLAARINGKALGALDSLSGKDKSSESSINASQNTDSGKSGAASINSLQNMRSVNAMQNMGGVKSVDGSVNAMQKADGGKRNKNDKSDIAAPLKKVKNGVKISNGEKPDKNGDKPEKIGKPHKKRSLWSIKITLITFVLSIFFSFLSEFTSSSGNLIVAILLLLFLILGNIVFDGIGVAVTACNISPLYSMSSRRIYGARTAVGLVKNAEKVSNICNDVIGDIFGIISGACSVAIVIKLLTIFNNPNQQILTIGLSAIVAALTVGGKALVKEIAIKNSKELVMFVSRIIAVFSKEERKCRKKVNTCENGKNSGKDNDDLD